MGDLSDKVALVTGGSRGLGAEIVRGLARAGAHTAFTYLQDTESAEAVASEVRQLGVRSIAIQAHAGDFAAAHETTQRVIAELGGIHILVCNAGKARIAPIWQMEEEEWDDAIRVSLKGTFNYIRAVLPVFKEQTYGKVVCIGSINGLRGRVGTAGYNAAKAGLVGLMKTVAAEMGRFNVNANLVAPGFIETPSQRYTPELIRDLVLKECSIKRLGTPEDIAPTVVFLCTEAARHLTGQVIKVDAGQYL